MQSELVYINKTLPNCLKENAMLFKNIPLNLCKWSQLDIL